MKAVPIVAAVFVALLIAGCSQSPAPSVPSASAPFTLPSPAVSANSGFSLTGVVSDAATGRPIDGANVSAWVDQGSSAFSYSFRHGARYSDSGGRFQLTSLPAGSSVRVLVWTTTGYVQQCAAPAVTISSDVQLDVQLVQVANLSSSRAPVSASTPGTRSVSGTIFMQTAAGLQPAANAFVDFEPFPDLVAAQTASDAAGRYLVCGVPEGENAVIGAALNGRFGYVTVPLGQTTGADITLQ